MTGTVLKNNLFGARAYLSDGSNYTASNNLDVTAPPVDPLFVDPIALNFQLQSRSRAKDAGMVIHPYTDGFVGLAPDIGAFEYGAMPWTAGARAATNPYVRAVPAAPAHLTARAAGSAVTLAWQSNARNETTYLVERSVDGVGFTPLVSLPAGTTSYNRLGRHLPLLPYLRRQRAIQIRVLHFARSSETSAATAIAAWTHSAASNPAGANGWDFWCDSHDWVKYPNVYFDSSLNRVSVNYSTDAGNKYAGIHVEFRLDKPTAPIIGCVVTQSSGGWNNFVTGSGTVSGVINGVHDLYITCSPLNAPGRQLRSIRSRFRTPPASPPRPDSLRRGSQAAWST